MERRKFVIGLGALTTGTAAAIGTGAFDSVEAERSVAVEVADDANAYLQLGTDRDDIISDDADEGTLSLDLGSESTDEGGEGFNDDAITEIKGVFTITNQGTQEVGITLDEDNVQDGVDFELNNDDDLDSGDYVDVDVTVDTLDEDPEDEDGSLIIEAEAED